MLGRASKCKTFASFKVMVVSSNDVSKNGASSNGSVVNDRVVVR